LQELLVVPAFVVSFFYFHCKERAGLKPGLYIRWRKIRLF
jgi:hypothetical protein